MNRRRAWLEILLLVLIVAASGIAVAILAQSLTARVPVPLLLVLQGAVILLGLSLLLGRSGQGWKDVGLRPLQGRDLGRALLLLIVCIGANTLLMVIVSLGTPESEIAHQRRLQDIASGLADGLSGVAIAATMLFVGVYEELTARGFLLSRCLTAFDNVWASVLVSSLLFGLGHAYQGWIGVAQTTIIGAVFAVSKVRWATLWPAIMAHAALNTISVGALTGVDPHRDILVFLPW